MNDIESKTVPAVDEQSPAGSDPAHAPERLGPRVTHASVGTLRVSEPLARFDSDTSQQTATSN